MREQENNKVTVIGTVTGRFTYDHMVWQEAFYRMELAVERQSGHVDMLPIMISERLVDVTQDMSGATLRVTGSFRSFNQREGERTRLMLFVFAQEVEFLEKSVSFTINNDVFLEGYLCKAPVYRKTPLGREICDLLVAVNRPYGKSDYIPCIVWGRSAAFAGRLEVGSKIKVWGRMQSRVYNKMVDKDTCDTRTAYELSVSKFWAGEERHE